MGSLVNIRAGLVTNLSALASPAGITFSPYLLSQPTAPAFEVDLDPEGIQYDQAMQRGLDEWWLVVRGFVSLTIELEAQKTLDVWLESSGATSVKALLESDRTLAGAAQSLQVTSGTTRAFQADNSVYLGAEWRVRVLATGT